MATGKAAGNYKASSYQVISPELDACDIKSNAGAVADHTSCDDDADTKRISKKQFVIRRINMAKPIDYVAGTYSCSYQVVCLWSLFLFTFLVFSKFIMRHY